MIADLREPRLGIHEDGTEELKTWEQLWQQCQRAADALSTVEQRPEWIEWLATCRRRDPEQEVKLLNYRDFTALLEAALSPRSESMPMMPRDEEITRLALEAGFQLNTAYGQTEDKLMPATDHATLKRFVQALLEER